MRLDKAISAGEQVPRAFSRSKNPRWFLPPTYQLSFQDLDYLLSYLFNPFLGHV